jgi:hypothetical protein
MDTYVAANAILTEEIAVEVTEVVGVSLALWYFRYIASIFLTTQAPVIDVFLLFVSVLKQLHPISIYIVYISVLLVVFHIFYDE